MYAAMIERGAAFMLRLSEMLAGRNRISGWRILVVFRRLALRSEVAIAAVQKL
jgi:hypothetical protein